MILRNIKGKKESGFTIVELLVVIVVIGILASITIVSYTGVTNKAKASKSLANANSVVQVAEAFNSDMGNYPRTIANFTAGSTTTKLPSGLTIQATDPTASNGENTFRWDYCGTVAAPGTGAEIGGRIAYWNYTTGVVSYIAVGSGVAQSANPSTANCNTWVAAS